MRQAKMARIPGANVKLWSLERGRRGHTYDHLCGRDGPPGPHIGYVTPDLPWHDADKEAIVVAVLGHIPSGQELAHDDGHERDGVLKARTIIDWFWMAMDQEQAEWNDSRWH